MEDNFESKMAVAKVKMAKAIQIAARKVELKPKEETGSESYSRISGEKEEKKTRVLSVLPKR
jgi:hypothetical protein